MRYPTLARRIPAGAILANVLLMTVPHARADTTIRIMPPDRATLAVGQRFDLRIEATAADMAGPAPRGLVVRVDGIDVTERNILDPGPGGERGAGGAGATAGGLPPRHRASAAPAHTTNYLLRDFAFARPGTHVIDARTGDGATARVTVSVESWEAAPGATSRARARNIILFLGDGMGLAHRTAARIVSRGVTEGRANGLLAMDTLEYTGLVMTGALNAVVTDSAPGMSSYVTGNKANNNQEGVFPDNTLSDAFDNPRVEYLGEFLRRTRGTGFNVGLVTTADVTDATPAANAVHTANRAAGPAIAARYFDERVTSGITVLMGGGRRHFDPAAKGQSSRHDSRDLVGEFRNAGFSLATTGADVATALRAARPPRALLGLFHPGHMTVAFDKVGAGRYSDELAQESNAAVRDQPMLDDMTRLALRTLAAHSPRGFYLMVEGASIDKQAHAVDAERTIWDTIEMDNAVAVALEFADRTNSDADPFNDTLVVVTADHECGGLGIIGVGNERYEPRRLGTAVRDYAAVFRYIGPPTLNFFVNYRPDERGFPTDPDPSRKLLLGWAAGPDRYENWLSNRLALEPSVLAPGEDGTTRAAVANPARDAAGTGSDNRSVEGVPVPGFLVHGTIENGEHACVPGAGCEGDTSSFPHTYSGHTANDVALSATGPGGLQFTGVYENTDVFIKLLRAASGGYPTRVTRRR